MRRERLIWFAAGAGVSALVTVAAQIFVLMKEEPQPYLLVRDRLDLLNQMENPGEVASLNAKMMRKCGARNFHIMLPVPDGGGFSMLPITEENLKSFKCIFDRAAAEGFDLDIQIKTETDAQAH